MNRLPPIILCEKYYKQHLSFKYSTGPDDYVHSTQEEKELIQILCDEDSAVEITISDSDRDVVPPSPRISGVAAARRCLKLHNSNGE